MRQPAGAALADPKHRVPAQAQVLDAFAPASAGQAPGEPHSNVGTTSVQHREVTLAQEVPAASLLEGCVQRYAPPAEHHVDPFGILGLADLWPANSMARVRPRPFLMGPAYTSSDFDLFTNVSLVVLVSLCPTRCIYCCGARTVKLIQCLPSMQMHSVQGCRAIISDRNVYRPRPQPLSLENAFNGITPSMARVIECKKRFGPNVAWTLFDAERVLARGLPIAQDACSQ